MLDPRGAILDSNRSLARLLSTRPCDTAQDVLHILEALRNAVLPKTLCVIQGTRHVLARRDGLDDNNLDGGHIGGGANDIVICTAMRLGVVNLRLTRRPPRRTKMMGLT